jgi:hypothetical protein
VNAERAERAGLSSSPLTRARHDPRRARTPACWSRSRPRANSGTTMKASQSGSSTAPDALTAEVLDEGRGRMGANTSAHGCGSARSSRAHDGGR